ncbi:NB-ARC domain-containing protein [Crossiella sp. SN42]|uniref:AfsR/SARP family transcriptional regulator n=1 Tax=Crossiella sp. SN42 TaxID=2944808 RepID=UPI00207C8736|nr:BTAD domain-containing putative transcriptional regulator [Crossiella sp. SN42]MCO1579879.1 NB-ARC domain-containing protein [Crossiella sp. SN42]
MLLHVLGPLTARGPDREPVHLAARKQRLVLATLALHAGATVSTEALVHAVWGEQPPRSAPGNLKTYVWELRRQLHPDLRISSQPGGYRLDLPPDALDLSVFSELLHNASAALSAGDAELALRLAGEALELWQGTPFGELDTDQARSAAAAALDQRWLVQDVRVAAMLAAGQHDAATAVLRGLLGEDPLREKLWAQLLLALYRAGRQAEALSAYRQARAVVRAELGIEPGLELRELHQRILRGDPSLLHAAEPAGPELVVPRQLPPATGSFTGREAALTWLDGLLDGLDSGSPLGTVTGSAGVGKTTLVVNWAHQVRDRFPDGQLYVNLRGYAQGPALGPTEALARFLRALGVRAERVPAELDEQAGLFRSLLAERRVLIVLDNASSADQVRPLLPATPGCAVVVTSRDALRGLAAFDDARTLTLSVLPTAESVRLLSRIIGADRVAADPAATAELARRCAHLPLALRIAAADLAVHPEQEVAEFVAELGSDGLMGRLTVHGDEQAAVRTTFGLSYGALQPETAHVFACFGLMTGDDLTAPAVAALAGLSEAQARQRLAELRTASLVEQSGPGRYRCHDLLRQYARERIEAERTQEERDRAVRGLIGWYLRHASAAVELLGPGLAQLVGTALWAEDFAGPVAIDSTDAAMAWLDDERANLIAAIHHAAQHGPHDGAWLLADALRGCAMTFRGLLPGWLGAINAALTAATAERNTLAMAVLHDILGETYWSLGESGRAEAHCQSALSGYRTLGVVPSEASVLHILGLLRWDRGQLDEADDHHSRALRVFEELNDLPNQALVLSGITGVAYARGDLARCLSLATHTVELSRKAKSPLAEAFGLIELGCALHELGRYEEAQAANTEARDFGAQFQMAYIESMALRGLAQQRSAQRDHEGALLLCRQGHRVATEAGLGVVAVELLNTMSQCLRLLGRDEEAIQHGERALSMIRQAEFRVGEVTVSTELALTHLSMGELAPAAAMAHNALTVAQRFGFGVLEGKAWHTVALVRQAQGELSAAREAAEAALAVFTERGHPLGIEQSTALLAALP